VDVRAGPIDWEISGYAHEHPGRRHGDSQLSRGVWLAALCEAIEWKSPFVSVLKREDIGVVLCGRWRPKGHHQRLREDRV